MADTTPTTQEIHDALASRGAIPRWSELGQCYRIGRQTGSGAVRQVYYDAIQAEEPEVIEIDPNTEAGAVQAARHKVDSWLRFERRNWDRVCDYLRSGITDRLDDELGWSKVSLLDSSDDLGISHARRVLPQIQAIQRARGGRHPLPVPVVQSGWPLLPPDLEYLDTEIYKRLPLEENANRRKAMALMYGTARALGQGDKIPVLEDNGLGETAPEGSMRIDEGLTPEAAWDLARRIQSLDLRGLEMTPGEPRGIGEFAEQALIHVKKHGPLSMGEICDYFWTNHRDWADGVGGVVRNVLNRTGPWESRLSQPDTQQLVQYLAAYFRRHGCRSGDWRREPGGDTKRRWICEQEQED